MKQMLIDARHGGYALGAFEFWSLDSAQAVTQAAAALRVPVILQSGYIEAMHAGGFNQIAKLAEIAANDVDIPVALHWDHGESFEHVRAAIDAGFTSVMIDCSQLPFEENVEATRRVVEAARPFGVTVESELGVLAGSEGGIDRTEAEALQTTPEEALRFIRDTQTDILAIAIGSAHGFYKFEPKLNIARLKEIAAVVAEPLVLHGGSGIPVEQVTRAIDSGIAKVNICTEFIAAFGGAYTRVQAEDGFKYNVPNLFGAGKKSGYALAYEKIKLFLNGKAATL